MIFLTSISRFCRPFTGLDHLKPDRIFEVLGLSEDRLNEFITKNVPEEKRENVQAVFSLNPILKSVCSITFYASMLCKVLQEEAEAVELNLHTYSQVTAFIILVCTSFKIIGVDFWFSLADLTIVLKV